jgi:hypothetical protein
LAVGQGDSSVLLFDVPPAASAEPSRLDEGERKRLWDDLASRDAGRAWRARRRLTGTAGDAVTLLGERLKPTPQKTLSAVADLDADEFGARQAAEKALAAALRRGDRAAEAALRELVASPPSLEPCLRARRLLGRAKQIPFTREELRLIRAVGVLEQVATDEAKALLTRFSKGGPSLLTAEARAALARLEREGLR